MDRRTQYTKKVIKETFIKLLNEKDITKISVSEICKIADINRATFYRYYIDIFDLLDKIEEEFQKELINIINIEKEHTIFTFTKELLNIFLENKDLVKIIFNNTNNIHFLDNILEIVYEKLYEKWIEDNTNISKEDSEYTSIFIFNGSLGIINYWIKNNFDKDIDEIANMIEQLSLFGTKRFVYKK